MKFGDPVCASLFEFLPGCLCFSEWGLGGVRAAVYCTWRKQALGDVTCLAELHCMRDSYVMPHVFLNRGIFMKASSCDWAGGGNCVNTWSADTLCGLKSKRKLNTPFT